MTRPTVEGKTVLVTGGAGFIGSHIAEALVDENTVRILDDFSTGMRAHVPDGATIIDGDVRDTALLREVTDGVDVIFHEAAVVDVAASVDDPGRTHDVNSTGTLAVLEAARAAGARVVLASSAAIYGHPETVPVAESHPKRPLSPYGVQKLSIDRYASVFSDLYDLETVILRYFNAYGPRGLTGDYAGVVGIFMENARNGDPLVIHGDGTQTRDFVHVDDVVQANLRAAVTEHVGEAFNIATGTETEIKRLARVVKETTGSSSAIEFGDPRPGDIHRSVADISKATSLLGYEPGVELAKGLDRLVEESVPA